MNMHHIDVSVSTVSHTQLSMPECLHNFLLSVPVLLEQQWPQIIERHLGDVQKASATPMLCHAWTLLMAASARCRSRREALTQHTGFQRRLAAVAGLDALSSNASLSGGLRSLVLADVEPVVEQQMLLALPSIERRPELLCRDAQGEPWLVVDLDARIHGLRQRALPENEELPPPRRRAQQLAQPGYYGRQNRLDVVYNTLIATLASASHVIWLGLQPGNPGFSSAIGALLDQIERVVQRLDWPLTRTLLRIDGAGGHRPVITACRQRDVALITRLRNYDLLAQRRRLLHALTWHPVEDSGSGPQREAAELFDYHLAQLPVRTIVSRFASRDGNKHGSGWLHEGYQYELFAAEGLTPAQAPAPYIVTLYCERGGQCETRYAQMSREVPLVDHLCCEQLPGQLLARSIAMLWWNLAGYLGQTRLETPVALQPEPLEQPIVTERPAAATPEPLDEAQAPAPEALDAVPSNQVPDAPPALSLQESAGAYLRSSEAREQFAARHGALFDPSSLSWDSVHCRAGHELKRRKVCNNRLDEVSLVYRAPVGVCAGCAMRDACLKTRIAQPRKELLVRVPSPATRGVASPPTHAGASPATPLDPSPSSLSTVLDSEPTTPQTWVASLKWTPDRGNAAAARAQLALMQSQARVWIEVSAPAASSRAAPQRDEHLRQRRHARRSREERRQRRRLLAGTRVNVRVLVTGDALPLWQSVAKLSTA